MWFKKNVQLSINTKVSSDYYKINKIPLFYFATIILSVFLYYLSFIIIVNNPYWSNLISNVSTGLMGAVFVSILFEMMTKKRQDNYLIQIQNASAKSLIKERIPESIYSVIEEFVVQQPCVPFNCEGIIDLQILDNENPIVKMLDKFEYIVENTQAYQTDYHLYIFEDNLLSYNGLGTQITSLIVENYGDSDPNIQIDSNSSNNSFRLGSYTWNDLINKNWVQLDNTEKVVSFHQIIPLKPYQKIRISISIQSYRDVKDYYPYIMTESTRDLKLTISYPPKLIISTFRLHPNPKTFKTSRDFEGRITTRIDSGILPYQGIQIYWSLIQAAIPQVSNLINEDQIPDT